MKYLIGNWKSFNTISQTNFWFTEYLKSNPKINQNLVAVICAPFTNLAEANKLIYQHRLRLQIGAQNVSLYSEGKHTGEVTASMLSELVKYCIVGHSERRAQFAEDCHTVAEKTKALLEHAITPIVCLDVPYIEEQVRELMNYSLPLSSLIFVYEPISAIGTGKPQDPEEVEMVISKISFLTESICPILYGGSITPENVNSYLVKPHLDGVLVGNESRVPESFVKLINSLSQ